MSGWHSSTGLVRVGAVPCMEATGPEDCLCLTLPLSDSSLVFLAPRRHIAACEIRQGAMDAIEHYRDAMLAVQMSETERETRGVCTEESIGESGTISVVADFTHAFG